MKQKAPRSAGIISIILAIVILLGIYTIFCRVDLVFMGSNNQSSIQEDVTVLSEIHYPDGQLTYTVDGEEIAIESLMDLRIQMAKTILVNFVNFNWGGDYNTMIFTIAE